MDWYYIIFGEMMSPRNVYDRHVNTGLVFFGEEGWGWEDVIDFILIHRERWIS